MEDNYKHAKKFTTDIADNLLTKLNNLNDDQLSTLIKWCKAMSPTNCWWAEYQMRNIIESMAKDAQVSRTIKG